MKTKQGQGVRLSAFPLATRTLPEQGLFSYALTPGCWLPRRQALLCQVERGGFDSPMGGVPVATAVAWVYPRPAITPAVTSRSAASQCSGRICRQLIPARPRF